MENDKLHVVFHFLKDLSAKSQKLYNVVVKNCPDSTDSALNISPVGHFQFFVSLIKPLGITA